MATVTISPSTLMMFWSQPKNTSANMAMRISSSAFKYRVMISIPIIIEPG